MTTWYIGEKVSTKCLYCNERLQTFVKYIDGSHARKYHIKCEKILREINHD